MRIWHIGASPSPQKVDGLNSTIWLVAREQALMGHSVALLLSNASNSAAIALAEQSGLELIQIPMNKWVYGPRVLKSLLDYRPPQIVHMHNVFLVNQATLAANLVRNNIPYIITPHGGLNSQRGQVKKAIYNCFVEKYRFSAASAITVVTPREAESVEALIPQYRGIIRWIANPINTSDLEDYRWKGDTQVKRLVYLGRFDVLQKGIDLMVDIARLLPNVEFHLYGSGNAKTKKWLESLQFNFPVNVHLHNPVFGADKAKVLADASLYIQTSRWEGFPISVAEAMYLGVPCAIVDRLHFSELFGQYDLGLVLPSNAEKAASYLSDVLNQSTRLHHWSERSRTFAHSHFQPQEVASMYLNFYKEILGVEESAEQMPVCDRVLPS